MVDVLLSSDSIDVLGGTSKVNVDVSLGQQGKRGSYIFVGSGDPSAGSTVIPETPMPYDMFINLNPNEGQYLYLYQYINKDGVYVWQPLLRLIPNTFLDNYGEASTDNKFIAGSMTYNLPLLNVIPLSSFGVYQPGNFNVQHTIVNDNPVASSVVIGQFGTDTDGNMYLPVTIKAVELTQLGWVPLDSTSKSVSVHFIFTVV
jgi:hypothetical protein